MTETREKSFTALNASRLSVYGVAKVKDLQISGSIKVDKTGVKPGYVLMADKGGSTSWKPIEVETFFTNKQSNRKDDTNITYNKGNVGIGVKKPSSILHVGNAIRVDGIVHTEGIEFSTKDTFINKKETFSIRTKKETVFQISKSNNIGIGYVNPDEKLVVSGNIKVSGNIIHGDKQFSFPDQSDIIAGIYQPQKLHHKTLETPIINSPKIKNPFVAGNIQLDGSSTISHLKIPVEHHEVATKGYVDMLSESEPFVYGKNVSSRISSIPTEHLVIGRFLIDSPLSDDELHDKHGWIAEWDGLEWVYHEPIDNHVIFLESCRSRLLYTFDVGDWVTFYDVESSHSNMSGLLLDDHPQYTMLSGREGGQTIYGGVYATDQLDILGSTGINVSDDINKNGGCGIITLNKDGGFVGIGCNTPTESLHVNGNVKISGNIVDSENRVYVLPTQTTKSSTLISNCSEDILTNKTLQDPILSGTIQNMCYKVKRILKSQILSDDNVLFIDATDSIVLTLPIAIDNPGRQYTIRMLRKATCTLIVSSSNRINSNSSKHVITDGTNVTTVISDGVSRWYLM
jgi:hypothetical protein